MLKRSSLGTCIGLMLLQSLGAQSTSPQSSSVVPSAPHVGNSPTVQSSPTLYSSLQPAGTDGEGAEKHASGHADHTSGDSLTIKRPKVFLDKSPKIIEYQLKRLTNGELLLVDRSPEDPKTIPIYAAILARAGLAGGERRAAADALAQLKSTSVVEELLGGLSGMRELDAETARSARDLVNALLEVPTNELIARASLLQKSLGDESTWARRAAATGLLAAGKIDSLRRHATSSPEHAIEFLVAVSWLGDPALRGQFRSDVLPWLEGTHPPPVRRQAIRTLATIPEHADDSFIRLAELFADPLLRDEIVRALTKIPTAARDPQVVASLSARLVDNAEATPIAERTSDDFVDAAQLTESFFPALTEELSRSYRSRMRAVAVRVVRIRTIEEEMRYDVPYFAVEAGRPVEIVLKNDDLMPHNLVVTTPGALKEIAFAAAKMAPDQVTDGKQYVPSSDKVLLATSMVPAGKQERLAFSAPVEPGEYPFVCTFPNHWMRMYGVMIVVNDLDVWQKSPTKPADPIGNNRSFVRKWTLGDLSIDIAGGLRGRSEAIGQRLFVEAACQQCHKYKGTGGVVGPELADLAARWKGDTRAILQEILDPSHKIDPKYAVQSVLTADGKVYSGIIVAEDKSSLSLITSPEQTEPLKIAREDIDEVIKSSKSIMPIGLLDQYTRDEIFELLHFLSQ